jgi:plasmid stabilization system protein ParE
MRPYVFTEEAELDLYLASDYIARSSPASALRWEAKILESCYHLADWPQIGRIRPEYAPSPCRVYVVGDYLIYNPLEDPLQVLAILHGARNLRKLLAERFAEPEDLDDE